MNDKKTIYYHETGMGEKDYAFLEYDKHLRKYIVRRGYCVKKSSSQEFFKDEEVYGLEAFLEHFPDYSSILDTLIAQIQREDRENKKSKYSNNIKHLASKTNRNKDISSDRRRSPRIDIEELHFLSKNGQIPVKLHYHELSSTGFLKDISEHGFAVMNDKQLPVDNEVRTTFNLGATRVYSEAIVRNITPLKGIFRIGFEFKDLRKADAAFLFSFISSKTIDTIPG